MAGIVTQTGAMLIRQARELVEQVCRVLYLSVVVSSPQPSLFRVHQHRFRRLSIILNLVRRQRFETFSEPLSTHSQKWLRHS